MQANDTLLTHTAPHPLDDVESLLYLIEFVTAPGGLPWANLKELEEIMKVKELWFPNNSFLEEFLVDAQDRRCGASQPFPVALSNIPLPSHDGTPDYDHLCQLLEAAV